MINIYHRSGHVTLLPRHSPRRTFPFDINPLTAILPKQLGGPDNRRNRRGGERIKLRMYLGIRETAVLNA